MHYVNRYCGNSPEHITVVPFCGGGVVFFLFSASFHILLT